MRVCVVGQGSIGKRHTKNLEDLGHRVIPIDIGGELNFDCDYAFICTPTQYHCKQAYEYLRQGIPTFIEKPLTHDYNELCKFIQQVERIHTISMVGCNLRFHPALQRARELIDKHRVIFARAEFGFYLPFWRKGDYTKSYSASESGGIILDDIHEIDYLQWLFGEIKDIKIVCDKVSDLDIKREDIAEIGIIFNNGVSASVHMDYLMKNYHRTLDLYFNHQKIHLEIYPTNLMYKKEVEYFMNCAFSRLQPQNGIMEAGNVLKRVFEAKGLGDNSGKTDKHKVSKKDT